MTMHSPRTETRSLEGWKASVIELSECGSDEIGLDECDGLVDGLVEIAKSPGGAEAIGEAGALVAGLYGKFRAGTEYGLLLQGILDRVCMVPGGHVGLGGIFGAIGIEDGSSDKNAYFALDVVRVVLRHLFLREGELRGSRREILGACYDAMLRVAERNGLSNLAGIMRGGAAREELCGPGAGVCRMAMLRAGVYDRRDVPSDGEILEVLGRHPMLGKVLDPKRVIESKSRLTELMHHITLDHLASREGSAWAHAAMNESCDRIGYWLGAIERLHDAAGGRDGAGRQDPHLAAASMAPIRYLALEICDFWELYGRHRGLVGEQDICDPAGAYAMIAGKSEVRSRMEELRDKFGARPGWTFERASEHVAAMGMERIVLYARLVLMFNGALCSALPSRHREGHGRDAAVLRIFDGVGAAAPMEDPHDGATVEFGGEGGHGMRTTLLESALCMSLLRKNFVKALERRKARPFHAPAGFVLEAYNIKYMILELANFAGQWERTGASMTGGGRALAPNFLRREGTYREFRGSYIARAREHGVGGIQAMVEKNPGIVSGILGDMSEAVALASRLSGGFRGCGGSPIMLMTDAERKRMARRLDSVCGGAWRRGGGQADPDQGRREQRAMEEVRRIVGP